MSRVLIFADDLSGAADCGIACVNAGLSTIVSLGLPSNGHRVDVLSVDADTRSLSASAAAERLRQLVQVHAEDPAVLLFKKIDSTLRGHLGPELAAVLKARRAVVKGTVAVMACQDSPFTVERPWTACSMFTAARCTKRRRGRIKR